MTRVLVLEGLIVKLFKEGSKIYMSLRTKSRERVWILIDDFRPYFYIPSKLGEYKSVFGETLDIVYADDPSKIPELRSRYNKHYEADIPYLRRFLIDTGLKQCVRVESLKNTVSYRELKPVECNIEPRVWFLDIEVYNILDDGSNVLPTPENPTLPVIAISIYDTYNKKFVTWIWHNKLATKEFTTKYSPRDGEEYVVEVRTFKSEELMLEDFKDYHALILPDIIAGWNISFDMRYLNARTKALGIYNNFYASDTLDLLEAYKRMGIKRRSYALKNVTVEEGIETRAEAVEARDVIYQWKENPIPIVKYNLRDVWRILKIDEKYNIIKYFLEIKHIAGIESIEKAFSSLVIVDTLILREARRKGIVLPSSEEHPDYGKFKGAYVLNPPKGIIEGVAVFDMSRYYPSLIISFNISPEKLLKCKGDVCIFKQDEPGLIPLAVENMLKMREELESELSKYDPSSPEYKRLEDKIMAVKGVVNSFYGVLGSPHFRLYDVRVAQTITALGREGLLYASRVAESMGYKAIYGDTDSLFIKVPFDKAEELSKILSDEVKKYFKQKYNLSREPIIKMKFEKYYRRILFSGAKKRYIGWLVWKKGKETDQIDITGFEGIRSDYPVFTTYAEEKIAEFLLKTDRIDINKIYEEIAKLYEEFKKRPLDEIALSKGLSKELHEYTSKSPHVRAAIYSNIYLGTNFKKGDKVRYVWVKYVRGLPATDVVAFEDPKQIEDRVVVDYDRQFRAVVVDPLNNIFEGLGIKIKSIRPKKTFW